MNGPTVNQPPVNAPRQMSKAEERVSLSMAVLQTIKVDEHEEEKAVLELRATAAGIVNDFLKATAADVEVEAAWNKAAVAK
jgi:hypothetical protein